MFGFFESLFVAATMRDNVVQGCTPVKSIFNLLGNQVLFRYFHRDAEIHNQADLATGSGSTLRDGLRRCTMRRTCSCQRSSPRIAWGRRRVGSGLVLDFLMLASFIVRHPTAKSGGYLSYRSNGQPSPPGEIAPFFGLALAILRDLLFALGLHHQFEHLLLPCQCA